MLVSMPSVSIGVIGLAALTCDSTQAVDELVVILSAVFLHKLHSLIDGNAGLLLAVEHLGQRKAQGTSSHGARGAESSPSGGR